MPAVRSGPRAAVVVHSDQQAAVVRSGPLEAVVPQGPPVAAAVRSGPLEAALPRSTPARQVPPNPTAVPEWARPEPPEPPWS